ncbi:MAG: arginine repressor [Clostridia bacterium]|nr:arginine repressor [Clostridia bacterium]
MRIERQNAILRLINDLQIETQSDLTEELKKHGFLVTQATVSRDIKELRLVKKQTDSGKSIYTKNSDSSYSDIDSRFNIIFRKCVMSIEYAVNNIVIKTLPGMAQAAGAAVDSMDLPEVVGSIAGDDTVMMVVRSEESARKLVYKLRSMTE